MTAWPLEIPLLRASAWFGEEPGDLVPAGPGPDWLDLAWGQPDVASVEPLQRRRLSRLARAFCHCAERVAVPEGARVVFASRHGEAERTLAILQDLAAGAEVSPTLFSLSVHNAVPGIWSILRGSRAPACALAAGPDTFGWGLVEALAAHAAKPDVPVLFLYADDRLPEPWAELTPAGLPHALALLLGAPAMVPGGAPRTRLTMGWDPATGAAEPELPASLACLRTLLGGGAQSWAGPGGTWDWQLA
jgi:hypothetical protein